MGLSLAQNRVWWS